tara:strand:+ start:8946 stop:9413 length:468 start_codon:yes stop_codon:yes gene_type:complete
MKTGKKAQVEIMGLVIILILVTISLILALRFIGVEDEVEHKNEFTQSQLGSNMLDVLLRSTSECGVSMTELLQDCSSDKEIECSGMNSCDYFEQETEEIFGKTLDIWGIGYFFNAVSEDDNLIDIGNGCLGDKKSSTFFIPSSFTTLSLKLDICG